MPAEMPTEKDFLSLVGKKAELWNAVRAWLAASYPHSPELTIGKKDYDWTIRYRKSGKTLVTLMPERDGFCVLVVLGKDEVSRARGAKLNPFIKGVFANAKQFHDGRWLWIRPQTKSDLNSILQLLSVKRRPS